jgi:ubiquinone/menaquinone biosynthesis C-methylase UbiE
MNRIDLGTQAGRVRATYNAAADHYCAAPLAFWDRFGRRTVERLALPRGSRVLDAPCGAGGSAIPAAEIVGDDGTVIAIDVAEQLVELGAAKARERRLNNIEFQVGDMETLNVPAGSFNAVVCVFGISFIDDMEAQLARFWRALAPGGALAITTWGPRLFAPMYRLWQQEVQRIRPDLEASPAPWDRLTTHDGIRDTFRRAGLPRPEIEIQYTQQFMDRPRDFWTIALGSGLRGTIDALGPQAATDVRRAMTRRAADLRVRAIESNVIYAVARKSY